MSDRAKLHAAVVMLTLVSGACARDAVMPVYDGAGQIRRLDYDNDFDGQVEMRAYLERGRTVRIEADGNADGVVDRWEYYAGDGRLERLGTSSQSDGIVDTWAIQDGDSLRVDLSTRRNGVVDRREFHERGVLVRAEQDTNGDGRIDQWQQFKDGRLAELLIDSSQRSGRPDTRLVYAANGSLQRIEKNIASR